MLRSTLVNETSRQVEAIVCSVSLADRQWTELAYAADCNASRMTTLNFSTVKVKAR